MNTRTIHILTGILFTFAGAVSLLDGIYHTRASNIFIGIAFAVIGFLYFKRKEKVQS